MKKIIASTALAAVLFAGAASANTETVSRTYTRVDTVTPVYTKFEGGFGGLRAGYSWTRLKSHGTGGHKHSYNPNGVLAGLFAGYGCNYDSVYLAGDVRGGYTFANDKKTLAAVQVKYTKQWNAGIGMRLGTHLADGVLGYFRLGMDYDSYKLKVPNEYGHSKRFSVWSVVPGFGIESKVANDLSLGLAYEYAIGVGVSNVPNHSKFNKKPSAHIVAASVTYHM